MPGQSRLDIHTVMALAYLRTRFSQESYLAAQQPAPESYFQILDIIKVDGQLIGQGGWVEPDQINWSDLAEHIIRLGPPQPNQIYDQEEDIADDGRISSSLNFITAHFAAIFFTISIICLVFSLSIVKN